jgi:glycosyltransferase involved in cell wall biosynthesis
MSDFPLVTVGMVTYNSGIFIKEAIESVLSSSYKNFELIIIDDASADDTWGIIQTYTDGRINASRNKANIGEYPNRNQIIERSNGEFLLFIDGDDMIYPHGLEFMTKMLAAFPESGMAIMRWYKKNIFYPVEITSEQFLKAVFFNYGLDDVSFANTIFRVAALKKIGSLPKDFVFGDSYARLKIGSTNKVLLISDGLTWWRETIGQASSVHSRNIKSIISLYNFKISILRSSNLPFEEFEKKSAMINLKKEISRHIMRLVKEFRICDAKQLYNQFEISLIDLMKYRSGYIKKDPFEFYSSHNPARVPISSNPFSSTNEK